MKHETLKEAGNAKRAASLAPQSWHTSHKPLALHVFIVAIWWTPQRVLSMPGCLFIAANALRLDIGMNALFVVPSLWLSERMFSAVRSGVSTS